MRGIAKGFSYSWKGFVYLWRHPKLWKYCILPVLINLALFFIFLAAIIWLINQWLGVALPETWYGVALAIFIISLAVVFILFVYLMLFAMIGSVLGSPFYEKLSWHVENGHGYDEEKRSLWQETKTTLKYESEKFIFLGIIHLFLLILWLLPGVGTTGYSVLGFLVTAFFLGFEYLDYAFGHRGWGFTKKRIWCQHHKAEVFGFGCSIFIFLLVPVVNVFYLPFAVVGGTLLFHEYNGRL